ncbi:hypothetical protein OYC64_004044 [Pagothenia borchgrevinki]|uniref:Caspase family p10 domain-containing protein n=1 Tax=Pagothenia borchgrevinki TaxID=8213 RepID=A0ABD2FS32_PAGBO
MVEDGLSCDDASLYAGHEDFEEDGVRIVNKEKDFLALLSSTPDTVSYRNTELGSPLIRSFVEVVNTSAHVDHIEELCRKVQQRFVDLKVTKQMPTKDRGHSDKALLLLSRHLRWMYCCFPVVPGSHGN